MQVECLHQLKEGKRHKHKVKRSGCKVQWSGHKLQRSGPASALVGIWDAAIHPTNLALTQVAVIAALCCVGHI